MAAEEKPVGKDNWKFDLLISSRSHSLCAS
jgi:hypothetical protein